MGVFNGGFAPAVVLILAMVSAVAPAAAQEPGEISGVVVDPAGFALPGATVRLDGPTERGFLAGREGRFRVAGLPPGRYRLSVVLPGFATLEQEVDVASGALVELELRLQPAFEDTVVVSASRTRILLEDAPTTISVVGRDTIETRPAQNVGDLLREVPGANVVQSSARDVNVATRGPSPFLTGTQMAMVDGRPLYFDFFNVIFWDLASVQGTDIEQIEVVRGPASAMWGANAATGVVNIVTRDPRDSQGLELAVTGGLLERSAEAGGTGGMGSLNVRWADAPSDRLAYRISAGVSASDPFQRPTGVIPEVPTPVDPEVIVGGGSYEDVPYDNNGTLQPKLDIRIDQELEHEGRILYAAGVAFTEGIIQTPIGPFDAERGTNLAYGQVAYNRGSFRAQVFANYLEGKAPSLISLDSEGDPLRIDFTNGVYDLDLGWTGLFWGNHLWSFGGNVRANTFDLSIAQDADDRLQAGIWAQDEIDLGRFRLAVAARADYFSNLEDINVSPRAALIWTPVDGHSFKLSYSRAFRAPSAIENDLELSIIGGYFPVSMFDPRLEEDFPLVVNTWGNPDLEAETIEQVEVGYTATLNGGRTRLELAAYVSDLSNQIATSPSKEALIEAGIDPYYTSDKPPPGWPLNPIVIDFLAQMGIRFPSDVLALNIGGIRNAGVELSVSHTLRSGLTVFANYSYQRLPEPLDPIGDPMRPPSDTIHTPPENRFNLGATYNGRTWLGSLTVNHSDEAFFAQGLQPFYYGYSDDYTLVNISAGRRWQSGRLTTNLKVLNLFDEAVQQHVFGDVLRRTVMLEALLRF
ncbi:MAG TPA: TonB-dependent receptor [Methylomirabilota bacterium]|nr:TonB-dependent receptor [Methylomirabilota bacterium]